MKERIKSAEKETEYARRRSIPYVEVRRMYAGRTSDQVLSHMGREIGSRTEITTRGKVSSVLYVLPELPADLIKRALC
jgi:hypothetical protein